MTAALLLTPRSVEEMESLPDRDLQRVMDMLDFLGDFPLAAQTANLEDLPEVRRAVAGNYLIFYRYDPEAHRIIVYSVRHGRRKPPEAEEILPE